LVVVALLLAKVEEVVAYHQELHLERSLVVALNLLRGQQVAVLGRLLVGVYLIIP
jgi:hypothetical protein